MKRIRSCSMIVALAVLLAAAANAQTVNPALQHFEKDAVSFDYPVGWKLTDHRVEDTQFIDLVTAGSAAQILIMVQPDPGIACASLERSQKLSTELINRVGVQIHAAIPLQSSLVTTRVGSTDVPAVEIHGLRNDKRATAYVGSLILQHHFVNLVYMKVDGDDKGTVAWETVRSTFQFAQPTSVPSGQLPGTGAVSNAQAIRLPQPEYPIAARSQRVSGAVIVEVEIDESGTVTLACAVSGHSLLRAASVEAAKGAKFSRGNLSGKLITVGTIKYQFVQ